MEPPMQQSMPSQVPASQMMPSAQPPRGGKRLWIILGAVVVAFGIAFFFLYRLSNRAPLVSAPDAEQVNPAERNAEDAFLDDRDRDGIVDNEEMAQGLSDRDFDTDGDGLSDAAELERWGTDPTKQDTDGDGFADGYEVLRGYDPTTRS